MQSRRMSFTEANTNAVIGLGVSWLFTFYGLPVFGFHPTTIEAVEITACYFVLSVLRSYILRRLFNR